MYNTRMNTSMPFLTEHRAPAPDHLTRSAFIIAQAKALGIRDYAEVAEQRYPGDKNTFAIVQKATATPGSTTTPGWGEEFVQFSVGNFLASLSAQSAAATLMANGIRMNIGGGYVNVPLRASLPAAPAWVNELAPIPVRQESVTHVQLGPARTLGSIVVLSRQLMRRSDAANIFSQALREDAAAGLDGAAFSTADGTGDPIEGLLHGATAVSGSGDLCRDLKALAKAVGTGGSGQVVFVAGTGTAAAANLDSEIDVTILGSLAVPENRLIALDPLSLVWAIGNNIEILASNEGTVHMSDTPLPLVDSGGTASPIRSTFQTDCVSLRLLVDLAFVKRRAAAVAYIDNVDYGI